MKDIFEKDAILSTVWINCYEALLVKIGQLGDVVRGREQDPQLWKKVLPDSERLWSDLKKSADKCMPQIVERSELYDKSNRSDYVMIGEGAAQAAAGVGEIVTDVVDAANLAVLPAVQVGSKIGIMGAIFAPLSIISLGFDIYNLVQQAKSEAELPAQMKKYIAHLKANLEKNKKMPLKKLKSCVDAFQSKVEKISV